MARVRITKQELRRQKDSLVRFERYLPTLQLKKKQLQRQIIKVHQQIDKISQEAENFRNEIINWVDVFAQENPLSEILNIESVKTTQGNVAGISLPLFDKVEFSQKKYSLFDTPLWLDAATDAVKRMIGYKTRLIVLHRQLSALKEELRLTNQRVNLFEKVKIPETEENIRVIRIYLGERRTAAVVRGKIAKAKIEAKKAG